MPQVPLYNHVLLDGKPTGLYELVGHAVNGHFVRNKTVSPLRTRQQWQAIDQAQPAKAPSRRVNLAAIIQEQLTKDVPSPPTMRDIVNEQRRRLGADLIPAPALRTNTGNVGVPPPPRTMEAVVALQRERGMLPPADVRDITVQSNPNHRNGQCWKCHMPELACYCPTVAPLVVHNVTAPRPAAAMVCRHCGYTSCRCVIPEPNTMSRVTARQKELRQLTN